MHSFAVNPKEYYQSFEDNSFIKKHKGIKKGSPGMDLENYTNRISLLNDVTIFKNQSLILGKYED